MNTIEMMGIMQAFVDGRHVQYRERHHGSPWYDMNFIDPLWDFKANEYRIKPEESNPAYDVYIKLTTEQVSQIFIKKLMGEYHLKKSEGETIKADLIKDALGVFGITDKELREGFSTCC